MNDTMRLLLEKVEPFSVVMSGSATMIRKRQTE